MHHFMVKFSKFSSPQAARLLDDSAVFLSRKFPSTVCLRKFGYVQKLWYIPLELLLSTPDLENFAMASRLRCQTKLVIVDG